MDLIKEPDNLEEEVWTSIRRLKQNIISQKQKPTFTQQPLINQQSDKDSQNQDSKKGTESQKLLDNIEQIKIKESLKELQPLIEEQQFAQIALLTARTLKLTQRSPLKVVSDNNNNNNNNNMENKQYQNEGISSESNRVLMNNLNHFKSIQSQRVPFDHATEVLNSMRQNKQNNNNILDNQGEIQEEKETQSQNEIDMNDMNDFRKSSRNQNNKFEGEEYCIQEENTPFSQSQLEQIKGDRKNSKRDTGMVQLKENETVHTGNCVQETQFSIQDDINIFKKTLRQINFESESAQKFRKSCKFRKENEDMNEDEQDDIYLCSPDKIQRDETQNHSFQLKLIGNNNNINVSQGKSQQCMKPKINMFEKEKQPASVIQIQDNNVNNNIANVVYTMEDDFNGGGTGFNKALNFGQQPLQQQQNEQDEGNQDDMNNIFKKKTECTNIDEIKFEFEDDEVEENNSYKNSESTQNSGATSESNENKLQQELKQMKQLLLKTRKENSKQIQEQRKNYEEQLQTQKMELEQQYSQEIQKLKCELQGKEEEIQDMQCFVQQTTTRYQVDNVQKLNDIIEQQKQQIQEYQQQLQEQSKETTNKCIQNVEIQTEEKMLGKFELQVELDVQAKKYEDKMKVLTDQLQQHTVQQPDNCQIKNKQQVRSSSVSTNPASLPPMKSILADQKENYNFSNMTTLNTETEQKQNTKEFLPQTQNTQQSQIYNNNCMKPPTCQMRTKRTLSTQNSLSSFQNLPPTKRIMERRKNNNSVYQSSQSKDHIQNSKQSMVLQTNNSILLSKNNYYSQSTQVTQEQEQKENNNNNLISQQIDTLYDNKYDSLMGIPNNSNNNSQQNSVQQTLNTLQTNRSNHCQSIQQQQQSHRYNSSVLGYPSEREYSINISKNFLNNQQQQADIMSGYKIVRGSQDKSSKKDEGMGKVSFDFGHIGSNNEKLQENILESCRDDGIQAQIRSMNLNKGLR